MTPGREMPIHRGGCGSDWAQAGPAVGKAVDACALSDGQGPSYLEEHSTDRISLMRNCVGTGKSSKTADQPHCMWPTEAFVSGVLMVESWSVIICSFFTCVAFASASSRLCNPNQQPFPPLSQPLSIIK